jgi:hypothetical protein
VPKSISEAERLREAAWVYAVRRTEPGPMVQFDWAKLSSVEFEEAVNARVMWQVALGARVLLVAEVRGQPLADSAKVYGVI